PLEYQLHLLDAGKRIQHAAQHPDAVEVLLRDEQLLLARARLLQVYGREDALVRELAVEVDFHVARTLELLEDHVIHAAASLDERRGDDRQAPAFLNITRRAEEPLRPLQCVRVHAARENLA